MEGKTIEKTLDMGQGYTLLKFDDGTFALAHIIEPEIQAEELEELLGEKKETKKETKKEDPKKSDKKEEPKKDDKKKKDDDDSMSYKDLQDMDYDELAKLCKENGLSTKAKDYDEDEETEVEDFRKAIAEECGIEVPDDDDDDKGKGGKDKDDDTYTWDDLKAMDYDELKDVIEEEDLKIDIDDYEEDDEAKLRKDVAKSLGIEVPVKKK